MRARGAICVLVMLVSVAAPAQDYSFSVPKMLLNVFVNPDASITMEYEVEFHCSPGAHAIDVVDMGLPHEGYDIGNMSASVNDMPVSGIKKSTYIDCGVEVPLGQYTIQQGQSGIFKFKCTMPSMVYQDTTEKDYASLWITPTWWGSQYVQGSTNLGVFIYLPPEIKAEEILHQGQPFTNKAIIGDHMVAWWVMDGVRVDGEHMCKLSFPKRHMDRVMKMSVFGLFMKWWREQPIMRWWREHPNVRFGWACVIFILFGIMFFRSTQGTGISVFIALVVGAGILFIVSPVAELLALPALLPIWYLCEKVLKRRRGKYLPAIASVSGGGIKRGLTAPEAAVILELPLSKVLTLAVFGLLKKGIVQQLSGEPLEVELAPEYCTDLGRKGRRSLARKSGTVIHGYEQPFIEAIEAHPGFPLNRIDFKQALKECVTRTARRMKGFDLERTRDYYRTIVSRAWAEANAIGEIEQRTEYADDNLLWLLVADDYPGRFGLWHHHGYYYHAPWGRAATPMPRAPAQTPVGGRTSLRDVSASFAGWTEGITGSVASSMDPVSVGLKSGGIVDLSGVDKVTVDMLESMAESSGSGGGGGGCACAGCACACACAGGGR